MIFKKNPLFQFILLLCLLSSCFQKTGEYQTENEEYDGPDKAAEMEFERTKDPVTGTVPRDRLMSALIYTDSFKKTLPFQVVAGYGNWTERGPTSDVVGPSSGNTRANSGVAAGRVRAVLVDAADATGNTVFVGGVNGGIWKTTNITVSPANWTNMNDFFSNMAITGICQNPATPATMYFCTGEWTYNGDAVGGDGIFKSTNGGLTWAQLANTTGTNYDYCSKIVCDASGNVYVSTRSGVFRSTDGGTNWTTITPSGLSTSRFSDMEISSTGRLHVSAGQFSTCAYRYTDNPSTVTSGTWTSPTASYPSSSVRIELGCNGNTLYALPSDGSYQVPTIYKSTDGGANWASTTGQPTVGWGNGQAWYSLAVDIDGSGNIIVAGLEPYRSTDGGATWSRIGRWVGTTGQYVHADIHLIKMYGANRVIIGCDGGIHYSSDGGTTIRDRNIGLRIKQFYSAAIHPGSTNYFLAGSQDNGSHQFSTAGLGSTVEVTGGDGAFVHIDQNEPQYQFTAYLYNQYYRSANSGASWTGVNLNGSTGQFINPTDYDDAGNIMYCGDIGGSYRRWTNPQTGSTSDVVSITALNGSGVLAVKVSPYTSNRVYFGTAGGRIVSVDAANTIVSGSAGTNISTGLPAASVSCIEVGTNDNNLICCYSNYGVQQIWVSSNGGTSWTNIDGNLPDMPVRWCMFVPGDNTRAIIATEAGVYLTQLINGGSTSWIPSPTFPTVRTDMLQLRSSDGLIAAATHGRGLWTQPYLSVVPANTFLLRGRWNGNKAELQWEFTLSSANANLEIEMSTDGEHFTKKGSVPAGSSKFYNYTHTPGYEKVYYRIKSIESNGIIKYSNTIRLFRTNTGSDIVITSLYPNPVQHELNLGFVATKGKMIYTITALNGQPVWRKEEDLQFSGGYLKNWNINSIPAGTYFITVSDGKEKASYKFIKK
ncbi:MAG: T9SS type A sorting domain-containing protein [Ferruginibacter sp.]